MAKKITPIDTHAPVKKVWFPLSIVMWVGSLFMKITTGAKIKKLNKLPKPPYLLLSTHASMMDFYMAILGTFPHQPYWVSTVEEFIYRYWLFTHMGVIPKRKFTNDPKSAMIFLDILQKRKKILVIYPEARYSLVGEKERLDISLGKFVKTANVPVVVLRGHGNYLYQPQWSDRKIRKVHPRNEMECIVDRYELESLSAEQILERIENGLQISEDRWMEKEGVKIKYPNRAVGLHKLLYKCPHCGTEFEMSSETHFLKCDHCGATYDYLENGKLQRVDKPEEGKFNWPHEWYNWEKSEVKKEVEAGTYHVEDDLRVEKLIGAKIGFVPQEGHYHFTHDIEEGFVIKGTDNDFEFRRSSLQSFGMHIEYNYLGRGAFLEFSTPTETYFVYPLKNPDIITKVHFATELIYDHLKAKMKKE